MKILEQKTAELLFKMGIISINTKSPFKFSSGILSPIYIDNRLIMSFPKERKKMVKFYIELIKSKIGLDKIDLISGTATAAIPMASWIAGNLNLPMVYVRKENKDHGKLNKIEGLVPKKARTIIIEDHISTGESSIANAQAIREAGGIVSFIIGATSYETVLAKKNFNDAKLKCFTLTTLEGILKVAEQKKIIKKGEIKIVQEWTKNPSEWGKNSS